MSQEPLYIVRDPAGAIYGPANVGTLQQWIGEGRITPQMHVAVQGTQNFQVAGDMPELSAAFRPSAAATTTTAVVTRTVSTPAATPYNQNYANPAYPAHTPAPNYYPAYTKSSGMATAAMICGIVGFIFTPGCILAIILGHIARGQIRREPERYDGDGMALAGLVLGYIQASLIALVFIGIFVFWIFIIVVAGAAGAAGGR